MQAITHPQARPAPGAENDPTEALTGVRKMNFIQVKLVSRLINSYIVTRLNL